MRGIHFPSKHPDPRQRARNRGYRDAAVPVRTLGQRPVSRGYWIPPGIRKEHGLFVPIGRSHAPWYHLNSWGRESRHALVAPVTEGGPFPLTSVQRDCSWATFRGRTHRSLHLPLPLCACVPAVLTQSLPFLPMGTTVAPGRTDVRTPATGRWLSVIIPPVSGFVNCKASFSKLSSFFTKEAPRGAEFLRFWAILYLNWVVLFKKADFCLDHWTF